MSMSNYESYQVRGASLRVDVNYESTIGIYGDPFWSEISNGSYEVVTFNFIEKLRDTGYNHFIDIGAATGCMTLYAASTGLQVISIEPQEIVYKALLKNVALNPSLKSKILLVYALVSKSKDQISISESFTPGAGGPISSGKLTSNLVTIKELLEMAGVDSKVAMKIDIEGAEFPLLTDKPTVEFLSKRKPTIYLALHPGFKRPLKTNANFISRFLWRIQASKDVLSFYVSISRRANIYVASNNEKINLLGLFQALIRDEKDYLIKF